MTLVCLLSFLTVFLMRPLHAQDYRVGEGDVLKITVYGHNDLTTIERIGGEGTIKFPLIGVIKVSGLTVSSIADKIASLLADGYIVSPQVTVFIEEFASQKVVIMGEVRSPGLYELKGTTTFLELVSKAGGLTKDAGEMAIIKRSEGAGEDEEEIQTVDLLKLLKEGDTSVNVSMLDGDTVYIPKAGVFYVTGEVKKPDSYSHKEGTTVIQAITMAGGLTDKAASGRIKIIRKVDGSERVINKVKMDEPIFPDDVVIVPESYF